MVKTMSVRKILFRGFPEGNIFDEKKWAYGDLVHDSFNGDFNVPVGIRASGCYPVGVNPDSVGQFTGLTDKNGVKIFEGDVCEIKRGWGSYVGIVEYNKNTASFKAWPKTRSEGCFLITDEDIEVIGSMFENPELIGGKRLKNCWII
jgi:hypothetical protein